MTCRNCVWFLENEDIGSCVRFPPQIVVLEPGVTMSLFPEVLSDMTCGEFLKKPTEDELM